MGTALIAIAAVAGFVLLCWKIIWPDMRENFRQLKESERKMGPLRFTALMVGLLLFVGLFAWLEMRLHYPEAYGHPCHGRGCMLHDIWYSPLLLRTHHWDEVGLFLILWILPATLVAVGIYALLRKLRTTNFSLYSDDSKGA